MSFGVERGELLERVDIMIGRVMVRMYRTCVRYIRYFYITRYSGYSLYSLCSLYSRCMNGKSENEVIEHG